MSNSITEPSLIGNHEIMLTVGFGGDYLYIPDIVSTCFEYETINQSESSADVLVEFCLDDFAYEVDDGTDDEAYVYLQDLDVAVTLHLDFTDFYADVSDLEVAVGDRENDSALNSREAKLEQSKAYTVLIDRLIDKIFVEFE